MKSALLSAAWIGLAVSGAPLLAQMQDNTAKQMTCQNGSNGDRARHCEIREQTLPAIGTLSVDSSPNGGATVKGWLQNQVLVRAKVESSADTQSAADAMASQVSIETSGNQVHAGGPESANHASWSVSYEIFVPQTTDVTMQTVNGGVTISDVRGQIRFNAVNGGVRLNRVAGDVSGETVNGGVQVELAGPMWDGRQLEVSSHNGGVTLAVPTSYSAHIRAETSVGNIQSDFPMTMTGNLNSRRLEFELGSGGPLIHVATTNGGVHLKRSE